MFIPPKVRIVVINKPFINRGKLLLLIDIIPLVISNSVEINRLNTLFLYNELIKVDNDIKIIVLNRTINVILKVLLNDSFKISIKTLFS